MIVRTHQKGDAKSEAIYSDCETYRYALTRVWEPTRPRLLYIMLNPSTATEVQNDPTIERCEKAFVLWRTSKVTIRTAIL